MFFNKKNLIKAGLGLIFIFSFAAFFPQTAGARNDDCSTREFSDGSSSKTSSSKTLNFPAGGGTNTDAKVTLPIGAKITSTTVDLAPKDVVGTPYIWVPLSTNNGLAQIKTSDGSIVRTFGNSDTNCSFSDPSRITVIPGGDVWVANRGSNKVTRLGPINSAISKENYECKGNYNVGAAAKGVTFDKDGNIWVGDNGDTHVWKFKSDGTYAWTSPFYADIGNTTYGMIADSKGNIWISTGGSAKVLKINGANCTPGSCPVTVASGGTLNISGMTYGIGINNDGDIWVGNWQGNSVDEIANSTAQGKTDCASGFSGCCTGTAVDGNNNVWTSGHDSNSIFVIKGGNCGSVYSKPNVCSRGFPHGIAIDFDNNGWVVCRTGEVVKYSFDGSSITEKARKDISGVAGTSMNASYNYSDMTGFRSIPTSMSIGATQFFPESGSTAYTGWGGALHSALASCSCPDASGAEQCSKNSSDETKCDVPLSLFSVTGGTYEAKNLNIGCTTAVAPVLGGLIPCGRLDNNSATSWDDTAPCNLCFGFLMLQNIVKWLTQIAVGIAVFILVIAGLFYVFSSGEPGKIELAKSVISYALTGLALVFIAWLLTGVIIAALGYSHPFTGGSWNIVDCPIS